MMNYTYPIGECLEYIVQKMIDECDDAECAAKLSGALAKTLERMVG